MGTKLCTIGPALLAQCVLTACGASTKGAFLENRILYESTPRRLSTDGPPTLFFDTAVRDFTSAHPDFQHYDGPSRGLVKPHLGPDRKPVYNGGLQLSSKENFDQWYNDIPGVNRHLSYRIYLDRNSAGLYVKEDPFFFPIDGQGWNDSAMALDGKMHNFYFSLELHSTFMYTGGEHFTFTGDDDVWVFFNGILAIDLGGVHAPEKATVYLDSMNFTKNSPVTFDLFSAERRVMGSTLRIETDIKAILAECTIWGDPHIDVFDNGVFETEKVPPIGIYTTGASWLVKSDLVKIQAYFGPTLWTYGGMSALRVLALGGPFLEGHTLIIQPVDDDGQITWDGEPILQGYPSSFFVDGLINITYGPGSDHIDMVQIGYPVKLISAKLPHNLRLTINRWPKHLDVIIQMLSLAGGQDGDCGNFNFDVSDDTEDLIRSRMSAPITAHELLFTKSLIPPVSAFIETQNVKRTIADCPFEVLEDAQQLCTKAGLAGNRLFDPCVFDICFGGKEFLPQAALAIHSPAILGP